MSITKTEIFSDSENSTNQPLLTKLVFYSLLGAIGTAVASIALPWTSVTTDPDFALYELQDKTPFILFLIGLFFLIMSFFLQLYRMFRMVILGTVTFLALAISAGAEFYKKKPRGSGSLRVGFILNFVSCAIALVAVFGLLGIIFNKNNKILSIKEN